ncbi:MAG: AAA family ATPase, partial [Candidatus Bathyarchaeia archaeon]
MESLQESPEEKFREFLSSFRSDDGEYKYRKKLNQAALSGSRSLIVDFEDLIAYDPPLAKLTVNRPDEFLPKASKAALAQLAVEDPEYAEQLETLNVRFRRIPDKVQLRRVGAETIGKLVAIDGIVVRATPIRPLIVRAAFKCRKCGEPTLVEQSGVFMKSVSLCPYCKSKHLDFSPEESKFMNYQELRVQERPEDLPPGQLPRAMEIRVTDDLVDVARPGDRVTITGIVRAEQERQTGSRLRIFELSMEANFIDIPSRETEIIELTPEEEKEIIKLSQDPWIHRKLLKSIAPSIYGYEEVKEAILYLLFGGVSKELPDGVRIRGDLNVLLVGDPGTAKSALLQYVARIAPRGLYTSGRGSTAAGLTAAVLREKAGGMVLEAGALVLADKGVASIDEIDKMRPEDRVAMHEAMEQQTVSVAKGGIVA